jgi:hypothetical protein
MIWVRGVESQPDEFDKFNGAPIFVKANALLTFRFTRLKDSSIQTIQLIWSSASGLLDCFIQVTELIN